MTRMHRRKKARKQRALSRLALGLPKFGIFHYPLGIDKPRRALRSRSRHRTFTEIVYRRKSKRNQYAQTPKGLYSLLHDQHHFTFDPCPPDPTFDGLTVEWGSCSFVNPPYNDIAQWLKKGIREKKQGRKSVFLIPVRVSTRYYRRLIWNWADSIQFVDRRIVFKGYLNPAPFDMMVVVFEGD